MLLDEGQSINLKSALVQGVGAMCNFILLGFVCALAACGNAASDRVDATESNVAPPPIPEGVETVEFQRPSSDVQPDQSGTEDAPDASETRPVYWGVAEGEPLSIIWEDLMPEGSEEELVRQYQEFYAMLEQRYAANTTTLADADPYAAIAEGSEFDYMPQLGTFDTVEDLDGELVRIPGYIVPFDFDSDARQREFLFVPYMGACIHSPPPPPNQVIFVRADPPIQTDDIWSPYWLEGTLITQKNDSDLASAAYALTMDKIEPYLIPY